MNDPTPSTYTALLARAETAEADCHVLIVDLAQAEARVKYLEDIWQRAWDQCVADDAVFLKIRTILEEQPNGMSLSSAEAFERLNRVWDVIKTA